MHFRPKRLDRDISNDVSSAVLCVKAPRSPPRGRASKFALNLSKISLIHTREELFSCSNGSCRIKGYRFIQNDLFMRNTFSCDPAASITRVGFTVKGHYQEELEKPPYLRFTIDRAL